MFALHSIISINKDKNVHSKLSSASAILFAYFSGIFSPLQLKGKVLLKQKQSNRQLTCQDLYLGNIYKKRFVNIQHIIKTDMKICRVDTLKKCFHKWPAKKNGDQG